MECLFHLTTHFGAGTGCQRCPTPTEHGEPAKLLYTVWASHHLKWGLGLEFLQPTGRGEDSGEPWSPALRVQPKAPVQSGRARETQVFVETDFPAVFQISSKTLVFLFTGHADKRS